MDQGYKVNEIYEVYYFGENQRSNTMSHGYMSLLIRMKQENDGWVKAGASSETPDEEVQQRVIQELYEQNGCLARMRPEHVKMNKVKRAMAKLNLNCLWGKFAQQGQGRTNQKNSVYVSKLGK